MSIVDHSKTFFELLLHENKSKKYIQFFAMLITHTPKYNQLIYWIETFN
jgi:hypothetical protein